MPQVRSEVLTGSFLVVLLARVYVETCVQRRDCYLDWGDYQDRLHSDILGERKTNESQKDELDYVFPLTAT